ncbi:heavy-metal-associated domain-containing protein [Lentilactobacillus laojiaonis]|uniref:heavy-metal-associated domain-containing protein n=1 Tax=Lentilactobacillus laojiaonis TaxID=2883998 RepID=UPI001D0A2534|nr:heavy-metal-associated domain-containing protein [Lentilactobacillus laojiaonis]UDM32351.1 heavy-metal-associated domain-containing protein [Lentilactobacillus laojiaonis]
MQKVIMQLDELSCPSCMQKIQNALTHENGVAKVKVLFNASKVKAEYDENQVDSETLKQAILKQGFTVKDYKIKEIS